MQVIHFYDTHNAPAPVLNLKTTNMSFFFVQEIYVTHGLSFWNVKQFMYWYVSQYFVIYQYLIFSCPISHLKQCLFALYSLFPHIESCLFILLQVHYCVIEELSFINHNNGHVIAKYSMWWYYCLSSVNNNYSDGKVHGASMGPPWVLSAPGGPHVGPINIAIRVHQPNPINGAVQDCGKSITTAL